MKTTGKKTAKSKELKSINQLYSFIFYIFLIEIKAHL